MRHRMFNACMTTAALVIAGASASADTLLGGFNGDLVSALPNNWEVRTDTSWQTSFVPSITEGDQALHISSNGMWEPGVKLVGGEALAQLIAANNTLELDVLASSYLSWRQVFAVINANAETVGWQQTPEFAINTPGQPNHVVIDLANPRGDNSANWKAMAQAWLDSTDPATKTYFELYIGVQGAENPPTADLDLDQDVDGADFLTLQQNIGNMEALPENGDLNSDFVVDDLDLQLLLDQLGRAPNRISTTIDNVRFVGPAAVAAVPEPTSGLLALTVLAMAMRGLGGRRARK